MISIRKGGARIHYTWQIRNTPQLPDMCEQAQGARHSGNNLPRTCLHMSMISFCQGDRTGPLRSILR